MKSGPWYQGDGDYEEGMEGEMDVEGDPTRFTGRTSYNTFSSYV